MTQRYSKYKDSGNEWIGEIPEHWGLNRLKQFGYIYAGLNGKKGDDFSKEYLQGSQEFVPFTTICNYTQIKEENFQYVKVKANEFQNEVVKNDLLFLMSSETLEDIAKSSVYLLDKKSLLNSFCKGFRIESNKLNPIYINYLLNCSTYRKYFELCGRGFTRINIKQEYVCNTLITIPPLPEQESIAQFLDEKCARIDEAIRIKEKQIDLLKEYRQIAIHQAVTKGLNDKVKMKDSGIDWIGGIPEHWEVKRLKNILASKLKYGANESGCEYHESLPRYIRISDFGMDGRLNEEKKLSLPNEIAKDYLLKDRDILFARSGATVGKAYQFKLSLSNEREYCFAGYLIKAEPDYKKVLSDFLYLYTQSGSFLSWKESIFNKATIENIGADKYSELFVPLPPLSEQTQIVAHLETLTAKTDEAIRLKEQQIEQLKQYKTSLINDVVIGKVRVA